MKRRFIEIEPFELDQKPGPQTRHIIIPALKRRRTDEKEEEKAIDRVFHASSSELLYISHADAQMVANSIEALRRPYFQKIQQHFEQLHFPSPAGIELCASGTIPGLPPPEMIRREQLDYHKPVSLSSQCIKDIVDAARYLQKQPYASIPLVKVHAARLVRLLCLGNVTDPMLIQEAAASSCCPFPLVVDPTYEDSYYFTWGSFLPDLSQLVL